MSETSRSAQQPTGATAAAEAAPAPAASGDGGRDEGAFPLPQFFHKPGSASPDARFIGKVRIDGPCLYIQAEMERVLPIWPQGQVRWSQGGKRFLFQRREYADGSEILVSGGEARLPQGSAVDLQRFAVAPDRSCDSRMIWFVASA